MTLHKHCNIYMASVLLCFHMATSSWIEELRVLGVAESRAGMIFEIKIGKKPLLVPSKIGIYLK